MKQNLDIICICSGAFTVVVSTLSLVGLIINRRAMLDWTGTGHGGMAPNTAVCFVLIGAALISIGLYYRKP